MSKKNQSTNQTKNKGDLSEQLKRNFPNVRPTARQPQKNSKAPAWLNDYGHTFPPANNIGEDGVDHINISLNAKTDLGRFLSERNSVSFTHPLFGPFKTVTGLEAWLITDQDDIFRNLVNSRVHQLQKTKTRNKAHNVRFHQLVATWIKICSSPNYARALKDQPLPLEKYYVDPVSKINIRDVNARWFVPGLMELQNALIEDRAPDLERFLDNKGIQADMDLVQWLTAYVAPVKPPKPAKAPKINPAELPQDVEEANPIDQIPSAQPVREEESVERTVTQVQLDPEDPNPQATVEAVLDQIASAEPCSTEPVAQ